MNDRVTDQILRIPIPYIVMAEHKRGINHGRKKSSGICGSEANTLETTTQTELFRTRIR